MCLCLIKRAIATDWERERERESVCVSVSGWVHVKVLERGDIVIISTFVAIKLINAIKQKRNQNQRH